MVTLGRHGEHFAEQATRLPADHEELAVTSGGS